MTRCATSTVWPRASSFSHKKSMPSSTTSGLVLPRRRRRGTSAWPPRGRPPRSDGPRTPRRPSRYCKVGTLRTNSRSRTSGRSSSRRRPNQASSAKSSARRRPLSTSWARSASSSKRRSTSSRQNSAPSAAWARTTCSIATTTTSTWPITWSPTGSGWRRRAEGPVGSSSPRMPSVRGRSATPSPTTGRHPWGSRIWLEARPGFSATSSSNTSSRSRHCSSFSAPLPRPWPTAAKA
mmetsp:Transcript_125400/g.360272  ORF Transcript_125400/g.360272 Transcript_125400/m.360272 type:complete len:236 (-) Transcript_125400:273-980(-)